MSEIAVLVPVLDRPGNAIPLVSSLKQATSAPFRVLFLCSPGDATEIAACRDAVHQAPGQVDVLVCPFERAPGDFARKTNLGLRETTEPWLFLGADDLRFHPGWDAAALRAAQARSGAGVIGTNDLGNPRVRRGLLSTHSLVRRSYVSERGASLDGPGSIYHEGYDHNFVDEELCALARRRGVFAFARNSIVEHLHPHWMHRGRERKAAMDSTYELGMAGFDRDRRLYVERSREIRRELLQTRRAVRA